MITAIDKFALKSPIEPFEHQRYWFEQTKDKEYFGLFWEMGTGKTKVMIDTAVHLFNKCLIDGVVIIAPKGCYRNWVDYELPAHLPAGFPHRVAVWSSVMKKKQAYECGQIMTAQDDCLDFFCINVEAFASTSAVDSMALFARGHYTMAIVDEATCIKNPKAKRTKRLMAHQRLFDYRRILTGTPITQGPLDMYAISEFLKRGLLGFSTFTAFRFHFADIRQISMGTRTFPKIFGYRNTDELSSRILEFSSRILKKDCLDLPEKLYEVVEVDHTPEQYQAYRSLRDEAIMLIGDGMVSTTDALTTMMRLHQINCGHVKQDDGVVLELPTRRLDIMMDVIEKVRGKVIIWGHFRYDMVLIRKRLLQDYDEDAMVFYHGDVIDEDRSLAIRKFTEDPHCRFFIGTPATGGKSITLVQAKTVIYYSNGYNLEHRLQSEDRAHRIGQKNPVLYVDLVVPGTVDARIVKALKSKKDLATTILDDYREMLSGEVDQPDYEGCD